tara:strand:+ start:2951 stop:4894 length:1944 start_codon:yes stop_codon:yes gene_type:complete
MKSFFFLIYIIGLLSIPYHLFASSMIFNPSKEKVEIMRMGVQKINEIIDKKLLQQQKGYNPRLNDFLYARRIFIDLTGTIPTYKELVNFVNQKNKNKRTFLINKLLESEGYVSHTYNYFADLLRIQTKIPGQKTYSALFSGWLKDSIHRDKPYNHMVYEMITASGSLIENPASGYLLRDKDMKLDHVAFMTKIFLAKDIACAQCHDHPSEDWTQKQYYAFATFLSELEIGNNIDSSKNSKSKLIAEKEKHLHHPKFRSAVFNKYKKISEANVKVKELRTSFKKMINGNQLSAFDNPKSELPLPDDYQYADAKPGDILEPDFIVGNSLGGSKKKTKREQLAYWLAHPGNGWFSMAIANRMWARFMGKGVAEPLHNIEIEKCSNPELLKTLSEIMVALDFDLRAFSWVIVHTKAYNRLATRTKIEKNEDYFFPGPILRRMSAEQIWDSLVTLMVKDPLRYRQPASITLQDINDGWTAFHFMDNLTGEKYELVDSYNGMSVLTENDYKKNISTEQTVATQKGKKQLILARASELPQPAPAGHFLQKFGQSERLFVVGASTKVGSVPQLMELMNGFTTEVLTSSDSLIFQRLQSIENYRKKAEVIFLSILNRLPTEDEKNLLLEGMKSLNNDDLSDLIWALLNTPEFFFIK